MWLMKRGAQACHMRAVPTCGCWSARRGAAAAAAVAGRAPVRPFPPPAAAAAAGGLLSLPASINASPPFPAILDLSANFSIINSRAAEAAGYSREGAFAADQVETVRALLTAHPPGGATCSATSVALLWRGCLASVQRVIGTRARCLHPCSCASCPAWPLPGHLDRRPAHAKHPPRLPGCGARERGR